MQVKRWHKEWMAGELFENIPTDGSKTNGLFNFVSGAGGTSGGTGSDNAADNNNSTTYLFYEASSGGQASSNSGAYLRWNDYYNLVTGATI